MNKIALILSLLLMATGCSESNKNTTQLSEDQAISWFDGNIDEAFALAKSENKPIFLYWGAVWCPPCQEIKQTVFKSRRFIAQTRSFVPIYLDGDTQQAQSLGEKFGVKGYPTMIVFSATGTELTRIPGGIDISRYNDVLELSLKAIKPVSALVQLVLSSPEKVSQNDLKSLAYYSWGQDHDALPEDYRPELFLTMSELADDEVSASRLYMQYLYEVALAHDENEAGSDSSGEDNLDNDNLDNNEARIVPVAGALQKVKEILASETLTLACWDSLAYYALDLLPHIATGSDQMALKSIWISQLEQLSNHESLSVAEQLAGLFPRLEFYFMDDEDRPLSPELKTRVLEKTAIADSATKNSFARQSVVNQINHVLQTANLIDEAKELLTTELKRSKSPYYFMSSLAAIAEKQNQPEEAIKWRRMAYEDSTGTATRFQWGANYIRTIIRIRPDDHELIILTSMALLDELQTTSEIFAGRNFRILRSLNTALVDWQSERQQVLLAEFDRAVSQRCNEQISGSVEASNCASLLKQG